MSTDAPKHTPAMSNHSLNHDNSQFAPRREFIRENHTFSTFALLALSGSSSVRLYSFPPSLIASLRQFFHNSKTAVTFREDVSRTLCEFTIEGRPWAMAKSITTEKLLVDLMGVIFRHGFIFLSTLDYGREQDDRLALAFSKPATFGSSRPTSPDPGVHNGSPVPPPRAPRVPFAISFTSTTTLRVINPPLNSTPAILQAVRGAWPRGVVAEKKVADTCFEFKLKGYKWFQEDTFAQDSLRHILTLLAALDTHGFKLLSSVTLTSRSRIKDLWLFTGASAETLVSDSPYVSPRASSLDLVRQEIPEGTPSQAVRHVRSATAPSPSSSGALGLGGPGHAKSPLAKSSSEAMSSPVMPLPSPSQSSPLRSVLRKPTPKSANSSMGTLRQELVEAHSSEQFMASLPSEVGSGVNMTGVGTVRAHEIHGSPPGMPEPEVIYETGGEDVYRPSSPPLTQIMQEEDPFRRDPPPMPQPQPFTGVAHRTIAMPIKPPQHPQHPHSQQPRTPPAHNSGSARPIPVDQPRTPSPPNATPHSSTLLSPGVFRDTTFSASTGWRSTGVDVPVTWFGTGGRDSHAGKHDSGVDLADRDPHMSSADSTMNPSFPGGFDSAPKFPGAWNLTPVTEHREQGLTPPTHGFSSSGRASPASVKAVPGFFGEHVGTPESGGKWAFPAPHQLERHDVEARVSIPAFVADRPSSSARKSEMGILGHMPIQSSPMPTMSVYMPPKSKTPPPLPPREREASGDGWVVIDVGGAGGSGNAKGTGGGRPPNRPRSSSDSHLHRSMSPPLANGAQASKTSFATNEGDGWKVSNQSLPIKEAGTMRRLFSLHKEPGSGNRMRKMRGSDAGRSK